MLNMNRRAFLVSATLAAVTALFATDGLLQTEAIRAETTAAWPSLADRLSRPAPVAVAHGAAHGTEYAGLVRRAVRDAGGVLARRGERVVIKPTLAWNRTPAQGANVHPDVLQAVVKLVLDGGAQEVLIFDRTALPAATAYRVSGARRAIQRLADARVRLVALTERDFVPLSAVQPSQPYVASGEFGTSREIRSQIEMPPTYICRHILEADRIINIATAKVHPARRVSLALANLLGLVGGGPADATWLQHKDTELALLAAAIRPDFTLLDATRAVVRNGPAGRGVQDVEHWNTIIASRDAVAVDAYGATRFGLSPAALPYLTLAEEFGVGTAELAPGRIVES